MSDDKRDSLPVEFEPRATPVERPISPNRPPKTQLPLIGIISLLVALSAVVLLSIMTSNDLSYSRSEYYTTTLSADPPPRKLRIGSFNIRYSPRGPLQPFKSLFGKVISPSKASNEEKKRWGEAKWEERREKLVDQVLFHELDIVGFQEVLDHQYKDLEVLMGEEFEHVGVGRDDGKKAGEAVPIFFRKTRFSLVSVKHSWLSPTPDIPGSRGWDAGQPRMVTIARLRDLQARAQNRGEEEIVVGNTHWDDRGLEARTESAKLILGLLREESGSVTREEDGKEPLVVLLGDLNSPAEEAGYQVLTGNRYSSRDKSEGENEKTCWDSRHEIATRKTSLGGPGAMSSAYGPHNTFTGFVPSDEPKIIDFILLFDNVAFSFPNLPGSAAASPVTIDTSYLDADDPDEVLASIPEPPLPEARPLDSVKESSSSDSIESLLSSTPTRQNRWKVSRYGVVPNFYEDIGGKRGSEDDGLIVSDHRLVVVGLEEIVA